MAQTPGERIEAARLTNVGTALMSQQLLEKAVQQFEAADRLDASLSAAPLDRGIALLYLQRLPEASEALLQAAKLAPNDPRVWYVLGLLYRSDNQPQRAMEMFTKVLALDPANADSHYFLGTFKLDLRDLTGAVAEFQAALKLDPLHASAQFGYARALQRQGKVEEARAALDRFRQTTAAKLSFPFSHNYGEEGALGRAEDAPGIGVGVPAMVPVTFSKSWESAAVAPAQAGAGGACLIDAERTGVMSLLVPGRGEALRVYRSTGNGFALVPSARSGLDVRGEGVACAVGDMDNDGLPDIALALMDRLLLFRNVGSGRFEDVTKTAGLAPVKHTTSLSFVDYDHDGDLDLFVTSAPEHGERPNMLWRNNGDKTFTDWTEQAKVGGEGRTTGSVLSDLNNDRAVDLLVTGSGSAPTFFANPRDGAFRASPLFAEAGLPPTTGVAVFDFNKDGWMDVALTHAGAPGMTLWKNVDGKRFERVLLPVAGATRGWAAISMDVDNDGWVDLAAVVETAHGSEIRVLRNLGPEGFVDVTATLKLNEVKLFSPRSLLAADLHGDGAPDLLVTQADGSMVALHNKGGERNHALRLSLKGLADNKSAFGTKVEIFANGLWQKWEVTNTQDILAGLGGAEKADLVRLLWPTGVPQDEIDVPATKRLMLTELDRRGSSCPTLFAWDGTKFTFISDVIGAAVVGHWTSPTERNIADPDEWVKIEGTQLKARDGKLSLRFGEPMEEVNFVDQVRLVAVDHPSDATVYPNEGFRSAPPFAPEKTILSRQAHPPAGAWDDHGKDVLPQLRDVDHDYVKDFNNLAFAGFTNSHTLTLDVGAWSPARPLLLLLHGYIEYFSASSMYAAWQAGIAPVAPYVEAQRADGSWQRVIEDMGFPAGLPRTIVVDLTGKLPVRTRRIRIVTNLQIYWDQALIDNEVPAGRVRQTELPLVSASLAFRGYPRQIEGATPGDLDYNYREMSKTGPFVPQRGAYTHYGEVTPLLQKVDDEAVIFGTGEDMDLEFDAAAQPKLPSGWVRDYFFYANGFVKDMDFYEANPFTVDTLPFHGMSGYPYTRAEHFPNDAKHTAYQLEWNDRFASGLKPDGYQFQYRPSTNGTPQ